MCLVNKHKDPSSNLQHPHDKPGLEMVEMPTSPVLSRWRLKDPWGSLAWATYPIEELPSQWETLSQNIKVKWDWGRHPTPGLYTHAYLTNTCLHTHTCTERTHTNIKIKKKTRKYHLPNFLAGSLNLQRSFTSKVEFWMWYFTGLMVSAQNELLLVQCLIPGWVLLPALYLLCSPPSYELILLSYSRVNLILSVKLWNYKQTNFDLSNKIF